MFSYLAAHPDLVSLVFVESYVAGPQAIARSFDSRMAYTLFLEDGYRQPSAPQLLPRICSEAIAGAILELIRRQELAGRATRMLEIVPFAAFVALAPFIGAEASLDLVRARSQAPR